MVHKLGTDLKIYPHTSRLPGNWLQPEILKIYRLFLPPLPKLYRGSDLLASSYKPCLEVSQDILQSFFRHVSVAVSAFSC